MNLILTMAGKYSRFSNAGFRLPKFLLPWGNRTILSEIINEMRPNFDDVYLICNKRDENFFNHVKSIMREYDININNLIVISETNSQSETAMKGIEFIGNIGSFIIHNIDTILYNRDYENIKSLIESNDGYIDIFKSNNHDYSYVMVDGDNNVTEIKEKVLISDIASSGMYGFKSKEIFEKYYFDGYISDIYRNMLSENKKVIVGEKHDESDTIVLGTPNEYFNLSELLLNF